MKNFEKNTYIPKPLENLRLSENDFVIFFVKEIITNKYIYTIKTGRNEGQKKLRVKMTVTDGSTGTYQGRFAFFATLRLTCALLERNFLYPGVQYKLERLEYGYRVTNLTNGLTASSCKPKIRKTMQTNREVIIGGISI